MAASYAGLTPSNYLAQLAIDRAEQNDYELVVCSPALPGVLHRAY
jgi:hypothetical protein